MAGHVTWLPTCGSHGEKIAQNKSRTRPLPLRLRTYSNTGFQSPGFDEHRDGMHTRHKSVSAAVNVADLSPCTVLEMEEEDEDKNVHKDEMEDVVTEFQSPRTSVEGSTSGMSDIFSLAESPSTPLTALSSERSSLDVDAPSVITYDFSKLDYALECATVLGEGLWSTVYLAEQKRTQPPRRRVSSLLPPTKSPRLFRGSRATSTPRLLVVKMPARPDAKDIFQQEARMLTHLQHRGTASQYIVPFCGLDERNHSLVFEAIIGGSLEGLCSRMKQVTEVARHLESIALFPGIAYDLINGLDFLHSSGVVHADIKPGNILLDISEHATEQKPVIRARYIDFSAAFIPGKDDSASNAGGTWDYMAPEQMRIQTEWNTPTFASDVWSLGITLLYILVGGSPYTAACGGNNFMLREAIKSGDPLQFARMDPVPRKRLAACQDFVDCCRQALKKDRANRVTANAWVNWLEDWQQDD